MIRNKTIAIVGCGVGGISAFSSLLNDLVKTVLKEIIIFDINPVCDSKIHAQASNNLLLNSSASINSLIVDQPDHFFFWVKENYFKLYQEHQELLCEYEFEDLQPKSFLKRKLFSVYMQDVFLSTLKKAIYLGIKVDIIREYVKDIQPYHASVLLNTEKKLFKVDQVILCVGKHRSCPDRYKHFSGNSNYFPTPYMPEIYYKKLRGKDSVLILGSMLSAVDAILMLENFPVKITLVSRSGNFPKVRSRFEDDLECHELFSDIKSIPKLLKTLSKVFGPVEKEKKTIFDMNLNQPESELGCYIPPFVNQINLLWSSSSKKHKESFFKVYVNGLNQYISAIPAIVAKKISNKLRDGLLTIKGGLNKVSFQEELNKFIVHYKSDKFEHFDFCINATSIVDNTKINLDLDKLYNFSNIHIIGNSEKYGITGAIFLLVKEVKQVMLNIRKYFMENKSSRL